MALYSTEQTMLAVIGGTGLTQYDGLEILDHEAMETPYGLTSSLLSHAKLNSKPLVFLSRHGSEHNIPPHKVNYRANIWALKKTGCTNIIAVNAVGGISDFTQPGKIILPDQLVDYTYAREHTFFEQDLNEVKHIDFSWPYSKSMMDQLVQAANNIDLSIYQGGTYACTQGPRLETAAEIKKLKKDGCDIVGMTTMPEAALARELDIEYVSICLVANWGAGINDEEISMQAIEAEVKKTIDRVKKLISAYTQKFL